MCWRRTVPDHYNSHGDVVQLTNDSGTVAKTYEYDAFGNEKAPVDGDVNPFRYCGEYYDTETGLYYLRARYYDPTVGRFTQEDTHWNTANMIYGDTPQKINEREDALGLKTYSYAPQLLSIIQAGNLYVYGLCNPIYYVDPTGELAWPGEIHNAVVEHLSTIYGLYSEQYILYHSPIKFRGKIYQSGRADLISSDGQVWEVKPNKAWNIPLGNFQLKNYVSGSWIGPDNNEKIGLTYGGPIPNGEFSHTGISGSYYVWYEYYGNGLILYRFEPRDTVDLIPANAAAAIAVGAGGMFIACIIFGSEMELLFERP